MTSDDNQQNQQQPTTDHPEAFDWTFNHPDGLPQTVDGEQTGAPRVHLSGDPVGGWIGDIHDGVTNFAASPEGATASAALDHLHALWQEAGNAAINGWDVIVADAHKVYDAAKQKAAEAAAAAKAAAQAAQGGGRPQQ